MKARKKWLVAACAIVLPYMASGVFAQKTVTAIDPDRVRSAIASNPNYDVAALWQSLGILPQLDTVWEKIGEEPLEKEAIFDSCHNDCNAEITRANLDNDATEEVILKVYQNWRFCRFLVFKRIGNGTSGQWRFVGHADHDFARHYLPKYHVTALGGTRYFVMTAQGISGTGVYLAYKRWYEMSSTGIHEVLALPGQGGQCSDQASLCREFKSKVLKRTNGPQGDQFVVSFTVSYSGNYFLVNEDHEQDLPLFTRTQRAVYVRTGNSKDYVLDPQASEVSSQEIRNVYNIDTLTCKDFLRFNMDDLLKIASSRTSATKKWLARYVDMCEPTVEKSRLIQALTK